MQHWQQKARNKASEEKRKGRKQGEAVVEWMRKQKELKDGRTSDHYDERVQEAEAP